MTGEYDLHTMLRGLTVSRRPGTYTVVTIAPGGEPPALAEGIQAVVAEAEGTTLVLTTSEAERRGLSGDFEAAWLTLDVHSALDSVGLTAAVSAALARCGIACNVLAGYHHDHLLVPLDRADDATEAIEALSRR